jgi:chromosome segregation ATPase
MDAEQLLKRVEWLDENRRQDKSRIATLENRLVSIEGELSAARAQVNELTSEITRVSAMLTKIDQFESSLSQHRVEFNRLFEDSEKRRAERERELEETRRNQLDGVNNHLYELRKSLDVLPDLQSGLKNRVDAEYKLQKDIDDFKRDVLEYRRQDEDLPRSVKLLEESRRQDAKRITDLQGEIFAIRKRVDEHRGRIDVFSDTVRKTDGRLAEIAAQDAERRDTMNAFFEKQALADVDRDRKWKDWSARFESIENQAVELEGQLQSLHTTYRDIRRLQEEVENAVQMLNRRTNEITELQRLSEDRFRQEWTTFKADDQKRWTNYALIQEEQTREADRQQKRVVETLNELEERLQNLQDMSSQMDTQSEKRMQSLMTLVRDWLADYERAIGRSR